MPRTRSARPLLPTALRSQSSFLLALSAISLAAIFAAPQRAAGDPLFGPPTFYQMHPDPRGIVIEDLNEDGRADLAIADATGSISVMLGSGDGSFPSRVDISLGALLTDLISGDWNGDGHVDLAASRFVDLPYDGSILVLLGNGDGTFRPATEYPAGTFTLDVDSIDLNRDGHPDYLLSNSATRGTMVWYMNNNVRISTSTGPTLPSGWDVAAVVGAISNRVSSGARRVSDPTR